MPATRSVLLRKKNCFKPKTGNSVIVVLLKLIRPSALLKYSKYMEKFVFDLMRVLDVFTIPKVSQLMVRGPIVSIDHWQHTLALQDYHN